MMLKEETYIICDILYFALFLFLYGAQ